MLTLFGAADCSITEMVGPSVRGALGFGSEGIVVVATTATIESGMYQHAFAEAGVRVDALAVPGLADAIEFGNDARARELIIDVVQQVAIIRPRVIVLACTHYPLAIHVFRDALSQKGLPNVHIFDPSDAVAAEVVARCDIGGTGKTRIIVSADNEIFKKRAQEFSPHLLALIHT